MSGDIITLYTGDYMDFNEKKLKLKSLHPECTYLTILNHDQCSGNGTWIKKLVEESPELKILFKSKMAVNRTPNHGTDPRNTLYIFEISDEYKQKIQEEIDKFNQEKKEAFPRFLEICKIFDSKEWYSGNPAIRAIQKEYNGLISKFGFNYYHDYKYKK